MGWLGKDFQKNQLGRKVEITDKIAAEVMSQSEQKRRRPRSRKANKIVTEKELRRLQHIFDYGHGPFVTPNTKTYRK